MMIGASVVSLLLFIFVLVSWASIYHQQVNCRRRERNCTYHPFLFRKCTRRIPISVPIVPSQPKRPLLLEIKFSVSHGYFIESACDFSPLSFLLIFLRPLQIPSNKQCTLHAHNRVGLTNTEHYYSTNARVVHIWSECYCFPSSVHNRCPAIYVGWQSAAKLQFSQLQNVFRLQIVE